MPHVVIASQLQTSRISASTFSQILFCGYPRVSSIFFSWRGSRLRTKTVFTFCFGTTSVA